MQVLLFVELLVECMPLISWAFPLIDGAVFSGNTYPNLRHS
jgi:hypothetical protein